MSVSNNCTIVLASTLLNTVAARGQYAAGIEVGPDASVTIKGDGQLLAVGGKYGAGIGSRGSGYVKPGKIAIESGTVVAQGGEKAAGIGGGSMCTLSPDNISITGGIVTATGGSQAAGIGSGYVGSGSGDKTLPAGAVAVSGGTVLSISDANAESDMISSMNTISTSSGSSALIITGGSVHGSQRNVAPDPKNSDSELLCYWLFTGLQPGSTPVFEGDIPENYSTNGIVADATGSVCLWLPVTNEVRSVSMNGEYFVGGGSTNNVFSVGSGRTDPADSRKEDGKTKWRITIPGLVAGQTCPITGLEDAGVTSVTADGSGRGFVYVSNGQYAFSVGGFDYEAVVNNAAVVADLLRVGVEDDESGVSCDLQLLGQRSTIGAFHVNLEAHELGVHGSTHLLLGEYLTRHLLAGTAPLREAVEEDEFVLGFRLGGSLLQCGAFGLEDNALCQTHPRPLSKQRGE